MATRKKRRNIWPFDAFKKTTVYHLRGRRRGVKESSTTRYKGHAIYKRADGYTVPSLDTSVFDDKREVKRFIDAMRKHANPKRALKVYDLYWSPTGQKIATVTAPTAKAAKRKAPKPYSKYKGEIYTEDRGVASNPRRKRNLTVGLPKNKFVTAKVRMKGDKIQVLVDESLLGHAGVSGHASLNPRRRKAKRKTARRRKH